MDTHWISSHYKITKEAFEHRYYNSKESLYSIARSLGVSQSHFAVALEEAGVQLRNHREASLAAVQTGSKRKYDANYRFFDTWSPEMAWVLGLLAADGCVKKGQPSVCLVSSEKELTAKFRQALDYTGPIQWNPYGKFFTVRIYNLRIANRLKEIGITPRKTFTLKMPEVPPEYLPHFTRGYCDGDGCISIKRAKGRFDKLSVRLVSASKDLVDGLHARLVETDILCRKRLIPRPDREHDQYLICAVSYDAIRFCEFMYKDCPENLCLSRKRQTYIDYVEEYGWRYANGPIRHRWEKPTCLVTGCEKPAHARGMCQKHYSRDWKQRKRKKQSLLF